MVEQPVGSRGAYPHLVRREVTCGSSNVKLGWRGKAGSLRACAKNCENQRGCNFFVYGYASRHGECIMERTKKASCPEGFSRSQHNFYQLVRPGSGAATPAAPAAPATPTTTAAPTPAAEPAPAGPVELQGENDGDATNLEACIGECDNDGQCKT